MNNITIHSLEDFRIQLTAHPDLYLLIYKKGATQSDCAFSRLESLKDKNNLIIATVNVAEVRDVHEEYNITSAPTLIEFKNRKPGKVLKGCHQEGALEGFFNPVARTSGTTEKQKTVIVYTTPTCSWCKTLKDYLSSNHIYFREIDVSKDEKAATEMVKRSGQQGVPQTVIDAQVVVGFDRNKINSLLNINA